MARPSLEVRRARAEDLDDLLQLLVASRDDAPAGLRALLSSDPESLRLRLHDVLADGDSQFLLARQDGRPVGFLMLRTAPITALAEAPAMHIDQLFVVADQRRHGVGRALISAVAGLAERAGADQVLCNVSPLARETHRFFARLGFAPMVVRRMVPISTLRRRLAGGEGRRGGLDDLLTRRRSLRARSLWPGADRSGRSEKGDRAEVSVPAPAAPPTLELPVLDADRLPELDADLLDVHLDVQLEQALDQGIVPVEPEAPADPVRSDSALA